MTLALLQKMDGWAGPGNRDWVNISYDPSNQCWGLRYGPAGDARLLLYLDYDLYNDDEYLVLVDLCDVPNRYNCYWADYVGHTALPARSLVSGNSVPWTVSKFSPSMGGANGIRRGKGVRQ